MRTTPGRFSAVRGIAHALVTCTAAAAALLGVAVPATDATSTPVSLTIVRYAVAATLVNTAGLSLMFNLGGLPGYTRVVGLMNPTTYRTICVRFPSEVNGALSIVPCSAQTTPLLDDTALEVSRNAVARRQARPGRGRQRRGGRDGRDVSSHGQADVQGRPGREGGVRIEGDGEFGNLNGLRLRAVPEDSLRHRGHRGLLSAPRRPRGAGVRGAPLSRR